MTAIRKPKRLAKHRDSRPTIYHEYWAERIREHILQGYSLRRFCTKPTNPHYKTVMKWQAEIPEFADKLAHARVEAAEADADFVGFVNEEAMFGRMDPNVARVVIDARKWQAAIRKPKKYGTKLEVGGGGADGAIVVRFQAADEKIM